VRDIIDRGGKAWRSYSVLLCRELWKDDRREPKGIHNWLALPELLHAGSLIIDDIQDGSNVRRGSPAVHLEYGVPLGINAGNLAYFLGETVAQESEAPDSVKLGIYACYFEAVRAGHLGQALDLAGPGKLVEDAVETGDSKALLAHLDLVYKLKTAVPSQSAARIGGLLAEAPEEWICGLERYFLELGIAFQMVDDALDMLGFEDNRKVRGGDLFESKWTWPSALALSRLGLEDRRKLKAGIDNPTPEIVEELLTMIGNTGAIEDTKTKAHGMSNAAWATVRPHLRDSHAVVRLRALSRYLLERRR
jgi:geranylgeranyl pyrophosphate synthase